MKFNKTMHLSFIITFKGFKENQLPSLYQHTFFAIFTVPVYVIRPTSTGTLKMSFLKPEYLAQNPERTVSSLTNVTMLWIKT